MPATEETWRSPKQLHVVFGITSLLMLGSTIWMLAADHNREWKDVQRMFRRIEQWTAESRIEDVEDAAFHARGAAIDNQLAAARATAPPSEAVERFLAEAARFADDNDYELDEVETTFQELAKADEPRRLTAEKLNDERERLKAAQREKPSAKPEKLKRARKAVALAAKRLKTAFENSRDEVTALRADFLDAVGTIAERALFVEINSSRELKFRKADLTEEVSKYSAGVRDSLPADEMADLSASVERVKKDVERLTVQSQRANLHRLALEAEVKIMTADEAAALKARQEHLAKVAQLEATRAERRLTGKKELLATPIIDAFGRPLKIDQIWLPKLTLNNNFRDVARFDRCNTCHQGIDKTVAGSAVAPAYDKARPTKISLATPPQPAAESGDQKPPSDEVLLERLYGMRLAAEGMVDPADVTLSVVRPESLAAKGRLIAGDVLEEISGVKILSKQLAYRYLLESVPWGRSIELVVRRGVPQPFSTHPKLDLFVGSLSPHPMGEFGCTICHDGQGSATAFKWASHTPNTPREMEDWERDHGWFNNHHWILPMQPERFAQSTCLKCHHDVTELEPSEKFPEPPAPKLMLGYNTIRKFGCFGCHEINGYDTPDKRRGPDLRVEPSYHAAAAQLLTFSGLSKKERALVKEVIENPENDDARHRLAESIAADADLANPSESLREPRLSQRAPRLPETAHKLGEMVGADDETPGQFRKAGPSLRYVASKVDLRFLYDWINNPTHFRPTTRMPRFFGLHDHLVPDEVVTDDGDVKRVQSQAHKDALRFEPIEVRGISEYLLAVSQKFDYLTTQGNETRPSIERGKDLFQRRGCLACHQHAAFPSRAPETLEPEVGTAADSVSLAPKSDQGPELSHMGAKLTTREGRRWLYSWVRDPNRYHARTVMPNVFLEPVLEADGSETDPAADITAWLLSFKGWEPVVTPSVVESDLNEMVGMYLSAGFSKEQSAQFAEKGIPAGMASDVRGDETELIRAQGDKPEDLLRKKLRYVGRRSIGRLGCSGCHDIPGFEGAKPIGTGLADWGRKETSKLAFEQIVHYLEQHPPHDEQDKPGGGAALHGSHGGSADSQHHGEGLSLDQFDPDTGFYVNALLDHQREGFIWQKLREPRSYDFRMVENKDYLDRLRMPKFNLKRDEIEGVITFVLGLVAEPPAAQYVFRPEPNRAAILEGEKLISKFNCGGCHTLDMESWTFEYDPDTFEDPVPFNDYAFLMPRFSSAEIAASTKLDRRGMGTAVVNGLRNPQVSEDDDGNPLYFFELWRPQVINGKPWLVGGPDVPVLESSILKESLPRGGDFARYLHPIEVERGLRDNPNVKPSDVWGWVPPPLVREGLKVQTNWLHEFLLNPYPIRPAVVLRMPKFNMTPAEASALVNYFAAVEGAEYPYAAPSESLELESDDSMSKLQYAFNLVTDNTYCVKCHLVGDFVPKGDPTALAPNLDRVYRRFRPDYLLDWLANPKRKLPYTGMPVNFPAGPDPNAELRQQLFPGRTINGLRGVRDLLMNYDAFTKHKFLVQPLVKEPPPEEEDPAATNTAAGG